MNKNIDNDFLFASKITLNNICNGKIEQEVYKIIYETLLKEIYEMLMKVFWKIVFIANVFE